MQNDGIKCPCCGTDLFKDNESSTKALCRTKGCKIGYYDTDKNYFQLMGWAYWVIKECKLSE